MQDYDLSEFTLYFPLRCTTGQIILKKVKMHVSFPTFSPLSNESVSCVCMTSNLANPLNPVIKLKCLLNLLARFHSSKEMFFLLNLVNKSVGEAALKR